MPPTKIECTAVSGCPATSSNVNAIIKSAADVTLGCHTQRRVPSKTSGRKTQELPMAHKTKKAIGIEYIQATDAVSAAVGRQPISRAKRNAPSAAMKKVIVAE